MSPKKAHDILGSALLANVRIGTWRARKHDREVTDEVNKQHGASLNAGRFHKHLFGGAVAELSALNTAASYLRWEHYAQTLPWSDDGWRFLPTANYMDYCKVMRQRIAAVEACLEGFLTVYKPACAAARAALGDMWRADDYPTAEGVRSKYHFALEFAPVPDGAGLRVGIPEGELKRVARAVEQRVEQAVSDAMTEAWSRLGTEVAELREKLGDGKYLRDAAIEKVRAQADVLGRLNLTGDERFEAARSRVLKELGGLDAKSLRGDKAKLQGAEAACAAILKSMKGLYEPSKEA